MPLPPSHTAAQDPPRAPSFTSALQPLPTDSTLAARDNPSFATLPPAPLSHPTLIPSATSVRAHGPKPDVSPAASSMFAAPQSFSPPTAVQPLAEVAPASESLPERVLTILNAGGLPALLRNVITRALLHHCGICGQWIASPTALKNHYRMLHADLFDRLAGQVDKQIMRHGIALNPCLYCNISHRHSRQHISHCISLWQSCFLHAQEVLVQLQSCFGGVLAQKRSPEEPTPAEQRDRSQKTGRGAVALGGQGKSFQGKGGRRRPNGRGKVPPPADNRSFSSGSTADNEDAELLHLLAKAVVRHEDSINILRRSTGWVWWARSGEGSVLPVLAELAHKWSEAASGQEIQPNRVSLRVTLLWGLLTFLKDKLSGFTQDQAAFAVKSSWADTNGGWNYQKWDAHHQMLIVDTSKPPLSTAQALESLGTLLQVINGDTLTRFTATQEIRADTQGKITFNADISLRAPGSDTLYQELVRLQGSALFQIIGVQFKPEGYNRPPLIRRIQQLIG